MATIQLRLVTPRDIVADEPVSIVNVTSVNGQMGIMPNHVAVMAKLEDGVINAQCGKDRKYWSIHNGLMHFENNQCVILADAIGDTKPQ